MSNIKLFELKKLQTDFPAKKVTSSQLCADFVKQFYGDDIDIFESMFVLLLNNTNITLGYAKISQGGILATVVDIRLICKYAIESLATEVILCHNHPSGNLKPSDQDVVMTKKVKDGLKMLDITLLDHIILTKTGHLSMQDEGLF